MEIKKFFKRQGREGSGAAQSPERAPAAAPDFSGATTLADLGRQLQQLHEGHVDVPVRGDRVLTAAQTAMYILRTVRALYFMQTERAQGEQTTDEVLERLLSHSGVTRSGGLREAMKRILIAARDERGIVQQNMLENDDSMIVLRGLESAAVGAMRKPTE